MRVGILSDSHGRADTTRLAVEVLIQHGAELILHLGDLGSEAVIDELVGHNARLVLGNCDWPETPLLRHAAAMGVLSDHPLGNLEVNGKRIAYTHGHLPELMGRALGEAVDYLLHGHTHQMRDERLGATRVINPGALFRASSYTAAVLDPAGDRVEFLEVRRGVAGRRPV